MWVMAVYAPANDMGAGAHRGARAVRTAGAAEASAHKGLRLAGPATGAAGLARAGLGDPAVRGLATGSRAGAFAHPCLHPWGRSQTSDPLREGVLPWSVAGYPEHSLDAKSRADAKQLWNGCHSHQGHTRVVEVKAGGVFSGLLPVSNNSTAASMPGAAILRGCSWPWPRSHPPPRCVHSHSRRQRRVACPQASGCREGRERTR